MAGEVRNGCRGEGRPFFFFIVPFGKAHYTDCLVLGRDLKYCPVVALTRDSELKLAGAAK